MVTAIGIDWVQVTVQLPPTTFVNSFGEIESNLENYIPKDNTNSYLVNDTGNQSQNFKKIYSITIPDSETISGLDIAQLEFNPRVSFIASDIGVLKISNRVLYSKNYFEVIKGLLKDFNLKFKHFTRLDYCIDFNQFDNGLRCEEFISAVSSFKYVIKGNSKKTGNELQQLRYSSRGRKINALTIGSRQSDSMACLYNKSLEMRQKKDKPWIREHWSKNGLDQMTRDVWRLEVSIKNSRKGYHHKKSKPFLDMSKLNIIAPENLGRMMQTLIMRKFTVAEYESDTQFCRLKKVVLFESIDKPYFVQSISTKLQGTSMVKYQIKKLVERSIIYKQHFKHWRQCNNLVMTVRDILLKHDLWTWFGKVFGDYEKYFASKNNIMPM